MPSKLTLFSKQCAVCGTEFFRRDRENATDWKARRSCSPACSHRLKAIALFQPTADRFCEVCGSVIVRSMGEASGHYERRRVCSKKCGGTLRWKITPHNARKEPRDYGTRACVICGAAFTKGERERPHRFLIRQTCSKSCADVLIGNVERHAVSVKFCEICGVELERYKGEGVNQYAVRTTCGGTCRMVRAWNTRLANNPEAFAPREYIRGWPFVAERIRERDGYTCQLCGESESRLDVHHIDYDKTSNADWNLVTLCISCHMKTNFKRDAWRLRLQALMRSRGLSD